MVINTNVSAQQSAQMLSDSSAKLATSLARLSSGSKIVSPSDDAAGLGVSMRFDAQVNRINATTNNIGNAVSFTQTQDVRNDLGHGGRFPWGGGYDWREAESPERRLYRMEYGLRIARSSAAAN